MIQKLYNNNNDPKVLQHIVDILNDGGLIIYPTDTTYAMGCHALKEKTVERICNLTNINPKNHHLSIICYDLSSISDYAQISDTSFQLMRKNLPGPFTFILPALNKLPRIFKNRKGKEVGIRMPSNTILQEIAQLLDAPIMTASLPQRQGKEEEYYTNPELIDELFGADVDLVLDAGIGRLDESTIVRCTSDTPEIIRTGIGELKW